MTLTDNDEQGKLFIGGLSWETSGEALRAYFSQFGEIVDTVVMKNNETGRSRGFGFITFKDPSCVATVLAARPHQLNGRTVDPKECTPRSMQRGRKSTDTSAKVFLGGLPPEITDSEIKHAFARFGKVTEVIIMYDQEKRKPRGFGFLSFESEDSIDRACGEHFVNINGKQIECKRAEPREQSRKNRQPQSSWGGEGRSQNWRSVSGGQQGGYEQSWGGSQQSYAAPAANAYGSYSGYGSQQPAASYQSYAGGYNQPPSYQSYGTEVAGYDYSQSAPSQQTYTSQQNYGTQQSSYGEGSYQQPSGYQSSGTYDGYTPKSQGYGTADGYSTQGDSQSSRGMGYHPYRR